MTTLPEQQHACDVDDRDDHHTARDTKSSPRNEALALRGTELERKGHQRTQHNCEDKPLITSWSVNKQRDKHSEHRRDRPRDNQPANMPGVPRW